MNDDIMNDDIISNGVLYLIFFGIGCFSFLIGINLTEIFPFIFTLIGYLGFYVFNILIFSLLFVSGLYIFKIRNFEFVLKTFIFSILFSLLILSCFFIAVLVHIEMIILGIPLLLIILFVINFQYLKEKPLINSTVKVFTISIIGFILSFISWI